MASAVLAVLSGCGGSASDPAAHDAEPQVASLPPSGSASAPDGSPVASGAQADSGNRPQLRLDDSPERRARLIKAWDKCLLANGAKTGGAGAAAPPGEEQPLFIAEPVPEGAKRACADKLPLAPPELDPALNPRYRQDWQEDVKCLRSKGIKVHLVNDTSDGPNGLTWTYDDDYVGTGQDTSKIEHDCEMEAFGGNE
ncbi:hypothetical protein ABZ479_23750 [Streptomyces sp. NPDC005722]